MFKRLLHTVFCLLLLVSCKREMMELDIPGDDRFYPEGTPVTLYLPFSSTDLLDVEVGTKAEAAGVDETRIHDLYVMIFDNDDHEHAGIKKKIYGRYYSYDHLESTIKKLEDSKNECWYVNNKKIGDGNEVKTEGAVKISTIACSDATMVVLANVSNSITSLDGKSPLDRLNEVQHLEELRDIKVSLEQNVVNRKDLFLMGGEMQVNTANMNWGSLDNNNDPIYDPNHRLSLIPVDAKVKFRVKVNPQYIKAATPVYWQVHNAPNSAYLYSQHNNNDKLPPEDILYFKSQQYYFEGKESAGSENVYYLDSEGDIIYDDETPRVKEVVNNQYYTFCFYMLENRLLPNKQATLYHQRELRKKTDSGESGYKGPEDPTFGNNYVNNGDWEYANTNSTYVQFDLILTLNEYGIQQMGKNVGHALTSDAIFTVHLGDFTNNGVNDYNTERGHAYIYTVTINNTTSIYAEVTNDNEVQSGQEGFLLLTDSEIINADCHYEYHQMTFDYRTDMDELSEAKKFTWFVKTPFSEGGPTLAQNAVPDEYGNYQYPSDGLDCNWVKFGINKILTEAEEVDGESHQVGAYTSKRHKYPGDGHYDPDWEPGKEVAPGIPSENPMVPDLMDITQLVQYIVSESNKEKLHRENGSNPESAFRADGNDKNPVIRVTAFIDEYYYEEHPIDHVVDPDLWRKFVNADPRELHILSDARSSRDRKSDVILSSHSIIQQSIQTIYNIHAVDLSTLWGTEHVDEMREKGDGWPYWVGGGARSGDFDTEEGKWNGRLNSAFIWQFFTTNSSSTGEDANPKKDWNTYLDYEVVNKTPELKDSYKGMAWSCLTRNRDNNGDGKVDRNEVRWYLAACNQLVGMWIGNESLSINARLYQPAEEQWRAHVISSSGQRTCWAEEGGGATPYSWDYENGRYTWKTQAEASKGESVRCLRNIGTYNDGGTIEDISYAPYGEVIDSYFTLSPTPTDADGPDTQYTFYFNRLNPKSLRDLSVSELPEHDQFNIANSVYLKMQTQKRSQDVSFSSIPNKAVRMDQINADVTARGYNPYCPDGYRFPNQSEMTLMSLYLPINYFTKGKTDEISYSPYIPARTYYDRGYFYKNTTGFEYDPYKDDPTNNPTAREQNKVGWSWWGDKPHCTVTSRNQTHSRCVRDTEMTGHIQGGIMAETEDIYPGDNSPVSLSFFSMGSSFVSAAIQLCYTDKAGIYHEQDVPVKETPSGVQYVSDQDIPIPAFGYGEGQLGFTQEDLEADPSLGDITLKITLRNVSKSSVFEKGFTLANPLQASVESIGGKLFPGDDCLGVDMKTKARTCLLSSASMTLSYTDKNGAAKTLTTVADADALTALSGTTGLSYHEFVRIPSLSSLNLTNANLDGSKKVTYTLTVTDQGGSSITINSAEDDVNFPDGIPFGNPLEDAGSSIAAVGGYLYPADDNTISCNLQSNAHSNLLSSASFKLTYTDLAGLEHEVSGFDALNNLSEKTYTGNYDVHIPVLTPSPDLSLPVTITATVTDSGGSSTDLSFDNIPIRSHITTSDLTILKGANIPLNVQLAAATNYSITSATLQWRQHDGSSWTSWNNYTLDPADDNQDVNTTALTGFTNFTSTLSSMSEQKVEYRLGLECSDGTYLTTSSGSVTVYDYGYEPDTDDYYITRPFAHAVNNIHFTNGDFIEVSARKKSYFNYNYEVIGFGVGTCTVTDGVPDVESGAQDAFHWSPGPGGNVQIGVDNCKPEYTIHAVFRKDKNPHYLKFDGYKWKGKDPDWFSQDFTFGVDNTTLVVRLDKDGIYFNNPNPPAGKTADDPVVFNNNLSTHVTNIINTTYSGTTFLMIGAAKGDNRKNVRSEAHYDYINVVRQPYTEP